MYVYTLVCTYVRVFMYVYVFIHLYRKDEIHDVLAVCVHIPLKS